MVGKLGSGRSAPAFPSLPFVPGGVAFPFVPMNENATSSTPAAPQMLDAAAVFTEDEVLCHTKIADGDKLFEALVGLLSAREPSFDSAAAVQTKQTTQSSSAIQRTFFMRAHPFICLIC